MNNKRIEDTLTKKALKMLKNTSLTTIQSTDILKIIIKEGIKKGLTDNEISNQIDDKYCKKELVETKLP